MCGSTEEAAQPVFDRLYGYAETYDARKKQKQIETQRERQEKEMAEILTSVDPSLLASNDSKAGFATAAPQSSHAESFMQLLFKPHLISKNPLANDTSVEGQQRVEERLIAQKDKYKSQAELRKAQTEEALKKQMRDKPQINENSKKLLTDSKHASYVNLRVEDRLRLYGIQLNETRASKAALENMNTQYESQVSHQNLSIDTKSMVSSSLANAKQQREFQKRQEEYA